MLQVTARAPQGGELQCLAGPVQGGPEPSAGRQGVIWNRVRTWGSELVGCPSR